MNVPKLAYPDARAVERRDTIAGVSFPDPYGWLEDETTETADWQLEQNALTDRFIREWTGFGQLHELVDRLVADGTGSPNLPVDPPAQFAGGLWFQLDRPADPDFPERAVLTVSEEAYGAGRVIFDPNTSEGQQITWFVPSPDGRFVVAGITAAGSDAAEIHIFTAATGERLPDRIPQMVVGPLATPQWLPDSSGFFFTAADPAAEIFEFRVFFHKLGSPAPTEPEPVDAPDAPLVQVAADGRHAVASAVWSLPRFVCKLPEREWRPFVQETDASICGVIDGDRYVAVTNHQAARGRVVAIRFENPTPDDPETWHELVPESARVLNQVRLVGDHLLVIGSVDAEAHAWVFDREGRELEEVPLPGVGALPHDVLSNAGLIPSGHPDEFVFVFSSPTSSPGVYRYRLGSGQLETIREPRVTLSDIDVTLRWAVSADGTRVPYHLVLPRQKSNSGPVPTLITAYGGGRVSWPAQYPGPVAAFVASGGALAISHQRGGNDLGTAWADAGRLAGKQNSFDDLYAVAGDVIASGVSDADHLAVTGWSSGGMMAGAALTQRPDLWAAVVAQCPILDVLGTHRHPYGRFAIESDYGSLDDPEEVRRLSAMSPYQLIRDGVKYPWLYVHAGGADLACPPGPDRKFMARLQHATDGGMPALLRVWDDVGHGMSSTRSEGVLHTTYWLAFLMQRLSMRPA